MFINAHVFISFNKLIINKGKIEKKKYSDIFNNFHMFYEELVLTQSSYKDESLFCSNAGQEIKL